MNFIKKIIEKILSLLKINKRVGNVFATVNQPCYDKNGNFLGWFSRSIAVAGFIFCRNKEGVWHVLGSERGKGTPDFQGYWNSTCGYLDFNETLVSGLLREIHEETGLNLPPDIVRFMGIEDSPSANHQNVTVRYAITINDHVTDDFTFSHDNNEKDEVGEIKWIPLTEVDNYKWAFGHGERIKEFSTKLELM